MKGNALRWINLTLALCLALTSVLVVIWQNSHIAVLWDLSYILENSYRISLGQVPYRDFPLPYAPLTFLTQAAIIKLWGRAFFHHVIYCAVVNGLSVLLTWRILLRVLPKTAAMRLLALILTVPLTVLGVYAIFPHPFYDCDCTFAVLICLLLLLRFTEGDSWNIEYFITGAFLVVPLFTKQNVGLFFLCAAVAGLFCLFLIDTYRRQKVRKYISLFAGLVVSSGLALALIQRFAGLHNYVQWTFKFAAQRRAPQLAEMIGMYKSAALVWWLVLILLAVLARSLKRKMRVLEFLSAALILLPFVWPVVYLFHDTDTSERAERLVNLWPLVLILGLIAIVVALRRRSPAEVVVPLIIVTTVHGAFLSQQLWGSTYALWPLFIILIAFNLSVLNYSAEEERLPLTESERERSDRLTSPRRRFFLVNRSLRSRSDSQWKAILLASGISVSLLIAGEFYLRSHERLEYANLDDGELTRSANPALKGLTTGGSWLTDFDELVTYAKENIPFDDGILCLPGEDLFYYGTGRRPQFPVLMFDHTVNPYSPQEIVDLARVRNINWLIVKDELQLEEEPIEKKDELMVLLTKEFESVESLNNYEIFRRKTSENEDDAEEQDEPKTRSKGPH